MTKQDSDQLVNEAQKYIGQQYIISDGRGNIEEKSEFLGTDVQVVNEEYTPLAVFRSLTKGDIWSRDLSAVVALYKLWAKK